MSITGMHLLGMWTISCLVPQVNELLGGMDISFLEKDKEAEGGKRFDAVGEGDVVRTDRACHTQCTPHLPSALC